MKHHLLRNRAIVFLVVVLCVTLIVYWPSFSHLLRGETYTYFLDTMGDNSITSLVSNWYNYEKVRAFDPGDTLLFRPLLFTTLGIEKALFGTNYTYWRIAAFFMHIVATGSLFRLLWMIRPSVLALLVTLLFSTSIMAVNTVLYEQIAPYMLFTALVLSGFYYAERGIETRKSTNLIIASAFMLVATFFHEAGVLFTILLIVYLWLKRRQLGYRWCLTFCSIVLLYLAVYIPEKLISPAPSLSAEFHNIVSLQSTVVGIGAAITLTASWLLQATLPAIFVLEPITNLRSYSVSIVPALGAVPIVLNILAIAVVGGGLCYTKGTRRVSGSFLVLLTCSLGIFILANSFFRAGSHGVYYLLGHNFNMYIGLALLVTLAYALVVGLPRFGTKHITCIALALVVLIGLNAPKVLMLNYEIRDAEQPLRSYLSSIDNFIELHRDEQDFSFNAVIEDPAQKDLKFTLYKVKSREPVYCHFTVPQVLYWKYWSEDAPKYTLRYFPESKELRNE